MTGSLNVGKNRVINVGYPQSDKDGVNLKILNKHIIKPSDTNRFAYLMDPTNGLLQ